MIKSVSEERFYRLWSDAMNQPDRDRYIAEYGYPEWFDEISDDPAECVEYLGRIHDIIHLPITELIEPYHLRIADLCRMLLIPRRTVENWQYFSIEPVPWVKLLIVEKLDRLTK